MQLRSAQFGAVQFMLVTSIATMRPTLAAAASERDLAVGAGGAFCWYSLHNIGQSRFQPWAIPAAGHPSPGQVLCPQMPRWRSVLHQLVSPVAGLPVPVQLLSMFRVLASV